MKYENGRVKSYYDGYSCLFQAKNGGVAMVPFYTYFITCNSTATIKDVIGKLTLDLNLLVVILSSRVTTSYAHF